MATLSRKIVRKYGCKQLHHAYNYSNECITHIHLVCACMCMCVCKKNRVLELLYFNMGNLSSPAVLHISLSIVGMTLRNHFETEPWNASRMKDNTSSCNTARLPALHVIYLFYLDCRDCRANNTDVMSCTFS